MDIQFLNALVGVRPQLLIIDGKLMTHNGKVVFLYRKQGSHIKCAIKNAPGADNDEKFSELSDIEIDLLFTNRLNELKSLYTTGTKNMTIENFKEQALTDNFTNSIVLESQLYTILKNKAFENKLNITQDLKTALNTFYIEELINYMVIYRLIMINKIRHARPWEIQAHLLHDLFIPVALGTKIVCCPYKYPKLESIHQDFVSNAKDILIPKYYNGTIQLSVISLNQIADIMGFEKVARIDPVYFQYGLVSRYIKIISKEDSNATNRLYLANSSLTRNLAEDPSEIKGAKMRNLRLKQRNSYITGNSEEHFRKER